MFNFIAIFFNFVSRVLTPLIFLWISIILFLISIIFFGCFDKNYSSYQFIYLKFFIADNINYCVGFGLDGLGLIFILLTTLLFLLVFLTSIKYNFNYLKEYSYCLITLEFFLIAVFSSLDILTFFFMFESVLIPMFLIIGMWGSLNRKIYASLLFFLFTLGGSLCLLFVIIILYYDFGTFNFSLLSKIEITEKKELFLWILTFLSFAVKVPMIPFHIWLPEAHVEAPSAGSVILAGVLLKLGGYGILRILLPVFPYASSFYLPFVYTLSTISIIYASLTAIRQLDLKRIVAYSSVAHMNIVILGLFSNVIEGLLGATFLMVAHGLVSGLLFFLIGFLYERYGTRLLAYYGGLVKIMPIFCFYFLLACLANLSLPGSCNFIGELLIFFSILYKNKMIFFFVLSSIILSAIYSLYLYTRLSNGNMGYYIKIYSDLNKYEICVGLSLIILAYFFGLFPNFIFEILNSSHFLILERTKF